MHVVGHEHIGVHGATKALGQLGEMIQIESVVFLSVEARRAIITALDDVPGDAGEMRRAQRGMTGPSTGGISSKCIRKTWSVPYYARLAKDL